MDKQDIEKVYQENVKAVYKYFVCDTVRDLLPGYVDNITSSASNRSIEEHIEECGECREVLMQMRQPMEVESAPEIKEFKKYIKRPGLRIFYWIMGAAALIAILTCFIVNLAVEKRLSWFYIVVMGILTAYLPAWTAAGSKKHRVVKAMAVLNLCAVALLGAIQLVLYFYMDMRQIWFWNMALPITALWSAVVWIGAACCMLLRANIVLGLGVAALLSVPANYLTDRLADGVMGMQDYMAEFVYNGLGLTITACVLLICGAVIQRRKPAGLKSDRKNP